MQGERIDLSQSAAATTLLYDLIIRINDIPFVSEKILESYDVQSPVLIFNHTCESVDKKYHNFITALGMEVYATSRIREILDDNLAVLKSAEESAKDLFEDVVDYMAQQEQLIRNVSGFIRVVDECVPIDVDDLSKVERLVLQLEAVNTPMTIKTTIFVDDRWIMDRRVVESLKNMYALNCSMVQEAKRSFELYDRFSKMSKEAIPELAETWRASMDDLHFSKLVAYYPDQLTSMADVTGLHSKQEGVARVIENFLRDPCPLEHIPLMDLSRARRFNERVSEMDCNFKDKYIDIADADCMISRAYSLPEGASIIEDTFQEDEGINDNLIEFPQTNVQNG